MWLLVALSLVVISQQQHTGCPLQKLPSTKPKFIVGVYLMCPQEAYWEELSPFPYVSALRCGDKTTSLNLQVTGDDEVAVDGGFCRRERKECDRPSYTKKKAGNSTGMRMRTLTGVNWRQYECESYTLQNYTNGEHQQWMLQSRGVQKKKVWCICIKIKSPIIFADKSRWCTTVRRWGGYLQSIASV